MHITERWSIFAYLHKKFITTRFGRFLSVDTSIDMQVEFPNWNSLKETSNDIAIQMILKASKHAKTWGDACIDCYVHKTRIKVNLVASWIPSIHCNCFMDTAYSLLRAS